MGKLYTAWIYTGGWQNTNFTYYDYSFKVTPHTTSNLILIFRRAQSRSHRQSNGAGPLFYKNGFFLFFFFFLLFYYNTFVQPSGLFDCLVVPWTTLELQLKAQVQESWVSWTPREAL